MIVTVGVINVRDPHQGPKGRKSKTHDLFQICTVRFHGDCDVCLRVIEVIERIQMESNSRGKKTPNGVEMRPRQQIRLPLANDSYV